MQLKGEVVRANSLITNAPPTETADMTVRATVIAEMKPTDFMEMIWTNDIIYLEWEIIRFRRAKANYIRELAAPDLLPGFDLKLGDSGLHVDVAKSIAANIDTLEQLERMIAMMEQRRNAAYHQAEQHRANLGNRLRQAVEQVEDAEFRELHDEAAEQKRAA